MIDQQKTEKEIEEIAKEIGRDAAKHIDDEWWEKAEEVAITAAFTAYERCLYDLGIKK